MYNCNTCAVQNPVVTMSWSLALFQVQQLFLPSLSQWCPYVACNVTTTTKAAVASHDVFTVSLL